MHLFPSIIDNCGRSVIDGAKKVTMPANTTIFYQGSQCDNYLLVIEGIVKVFTRSESGREVVLYRVSKEQSCTLTTTCLLANNQYPAEGISETVVEALVIPSKMFTMGLAKSASFREFVFNTYAKQLCDVISLVGEVSFNRIDVRLAKQLITSGNHVLTTTHQALATELGTAREVVSRQLKSFEEKKLIALSRGKITLVNMTQLNSLANTALV